MITVLVPLIKNLLFIAIGVFGIGLLVGLHEYGHYLFARLFGVRVPSFSIGMGPTVWSKVIGQTEFKFSAIPLGGYVEIAGLAEVGQGDQSEAHAMDAGSFQRKKYWQKALILCGGVLFNILFTYLVFAGLFFTGMPQSLFYKPENVKPVIARIYDNSCAAKINLMPGDEIIAINQQPVDNIVQTMSLLQSLKEKTITLTIKRCGQESTIATTLDQTGRLGVTFQPTFLAPHTFWSSIKEGVNLTAEYVAAIGKTFAQLFKKRSLEGIGGPLHIISGLMTSAQQYFSFFLFFLAFISINLAVLNVIPLPITDGGQFIIESIQSGMGRQLPEKVRLVIHYASWALLMALTTYLTVKDAIVLIWPKISAWF